jgi:hypothetical protein
MLLTHRLIQPFFGVGKTRGLSFGRMLVKSLSESEQKRNCGSLKTSRNNRAHGSLPHVPYFASKQGSPGLLRGRWTTSRRDQSATKECLALPFTVAGAAVASLSSASEVGGLP